VQKLEAACYLCERRKGGGAEHRLQDVDLNRINQNSQNVRIGMAMSESAGKEPTPEDRYLKKMRGIIRSHTHQERINTLFLRIKSRLRELEELARDLEETEEDGVYRFYHGSNKVFCLQDPVKKAFTLKRPNRPPV
jgi:hypothetical protein